MQRLTKKTLSCAVSVAACLTAASAFAETQITVATVNNGHMIEMQKLTPEFEKANPGIKVKWVTLEEGVLRQNVTQDIANKSGLYDVMTIGMYEAPIWGERGWLREIDTSGNYDVNDILPSIRGGLSYDNTLYAAPFYGESSMVMYRKDLVKAAGMEINDRDSWTHIRDVAAAVHDPDNGVYGICLRGKAGWGDNMALMTTIANSFGARWFDENWKPQLESAEWKKAVSFYVDTLSKYGPPGSSSNSFNENLALFNEGKCGMWIDATIAASFVTDPKQSKVHDKVGFAQSPYAVSQKGANWLWAWALGIPAATKHSVEAQKFVRWATSKQYINLVGKTNGWAAVPTGTRTSTYENAKFQKAAVFAEAELKAINSANPNDSTMKPSPYVGVQFAAIPEFQAIGTTAGQMVSGALSGTMSVEQALQSANRSADRQMRQAGYY
ncbi:ABC transporter substrate-binding protein [Marinomonas posidonica]|uniref:Extracellular solute-binding protein family 1 n=1 Tax=Marinomonas posidonica (strain CECT 7376 / NCIMB 14433 / IVIA-Po-181) TaxID=491952 RepID=F6CZG8_MARPP|nr:sugar ABC transporter substrate-binding protein [Marinomonas posidonica]AEF55780.1 extracellular solute-binding protein family 1 [Marinomonas posidonica IVIA-Po-181]